mmetsp:Transcript_50589/g.117952  ORF Transcript_50589/g.117952 Transcript_50589/m.117952 type:complete len:582 (-) Transcript_50589:316-2061(-)
MKPFFLAAGSCSPSRKTRAPSADLCLQSLPVPPPPPTRLSVNLDDSAALEPVDVVKANRRVQPHPLTITPIPETEEDGKASPECTKTPRQHVSRPWREKPPTPTTPSRWTKASHTMTALQSEKVSGLLQHRSQVTRQVRRRIRAFDKRVAILSSGGRKTATKHAGENTSTGDAGDYTRLDSSWLADEEHEAADELEGMPFKVIGWSSQRGNFPAYNLLGTSSCWQSEIGMTRDQHLSFEVEDIPAPVVAIQMEVVTKEVTPKRCKLMFSTNSATGPWQTAWTFTVPESVAEKGSTVFYRSKEEVKEHVESAPWWRLVIFDNYGSQACVAIAAPLKLLVAARGEHVRMKHVRRNKITFLEDSFFAQKHLMSNLTPEERSDKRLATTYKINAAFIQQAHQQFDATENGKSGRWTKKDFCHWLLEFLPAKERSKLAPERMNFYWNRVDKDEETHCMDFEEFLIFYHVLNSTAAKYGRSIGEYVFPGLIKIPEGQSETQVEEGSKGSDVIALFAGSGQSKQDDHKNQQRRPSAFGGREEDDLALISLPAGRAGTKSSLPDFAGMDMSLISVRRQPKKVAPGSGPT